MVFVEKSGVSGCTGHHRGQIIIQGPKSVFASNVGLKKEIDEWPTRANKASVALDIHFHKVTPNQCDQKKSPNV